MKKYLVSTSGIHAVRFLDHLPWQTSGYGGDDSQRFTAYAKLYAELAKPITITVNDAELAELTAILGKFSDLTLHVENADE